MEHHFNVAAEVSPTTGKQTCKSITQGRDQMCQRSLYVETPHDSVRASMSYALVPNNQTEAQAYFDGHVDNSLRFSLLESLCRPCHCHSCPSSSCTNQNLHVPMIQAFCRLRALPISADSSLRSNPLRKQNCIIANLPAKVVVAMSLKSELAKLPGAKLSCQL